MNKIKRVCYLLLLLPLLHSCSTSYVYNNLDWMVNWYVDDYVTLNAKQQKNFDQRFKLLQEWHRNNELQVYQIWLLEIRAQLEQADRPRNEMLEDVRFHRQKTLEFWSRLVESAEPHLLVLLDELEEQQRRELENNFKRQLLERYKKKQAMSRREWENDRISKMEKGLKPWVGSLTTAQKKIVKDWAKSLHNVDELNQTFRLQWFSRLTGLQSLSLAQRQGKLAELVTFPDRYRSPEHLKLLEENRHVTEVAIAEVLVLRSSRQNRKALSEVDTWLNRIRNARS